MRMNKYFIQPKPCARLANDDAYNSLSVKQKKLCDLLIQRNKIRNCRANLHQKRIILANKIYQDCCQRFSRLPIELGLYFFVIE